MKAHRLASYFPIMEDEKFEKFKQDIKENGQLEPIITFDNQILDGLNRYRACTELGITPQFKAYGGKDPLHYVVSVNVHRRHMSVSQLAMVATEMLPEFEKEAKARKGRSTADKTAEDLPKDNQGFARATTVIAEKFGVSGSSVQKAKRIKEQAPERVTNIIQGKETVESVNVDLRIKAEKERKDRAVAEGRNQKTGLEISIEQQQYINTLESIVSMLPKTPPTDWAQDNFGLAQGYANIIINRLEVFNG